MRWYRLAADQGNASAQYNLGVMDGNGEGVLQDYVEAHMWFNLAAAQSSGECTSSNQFGPVSLFHKRDFLPVDRPARCA